MTEERHAYLLDGRKCRVLHETDNEVYLMTLIPVQAWDDPGCTIDGHIIVRHPDDVFDQPPTELYHKEVAQLTEKIKRLRRARRRLEDALQSEKDRYTWNIERLQAQSMALERVRDFIEGKITHYVIIEGRRCPDILRVEEAVCEYDQKEFRFLSLTPKRKGKAVVWRLNQYGDGSGSDKEVIPCTSYEEAKAVILDRIKKRFSAGNVNRHDFGRMRRHEIEPPAGYVDTLVENERAKAVRERVSKIKEANTAFEERRREWEAMRDDG